MLVSYFVRISESCLGTKGLVVVVVSVSPVSATKVLMVANISVVKVQTVGTKGGAEVQRARGRR